MAEFPKEFVWGAATAAYQIEGGATEGGKGLSIWDVFSHTPGCTYRGETGDVACDSYHRWKEDLALLQSMHLKAYRFSVAWTRIAPNGGTDWSEEGFAYYDTLVDASRILRCITGICRRRWKKRAAGAVRKRHARLQAMPQRWQSTSKAGYISGSPSTSLPAS